MPRPKEYERVAVLDDAMRCFWRHGYYATSVSHLVAASGVNRHALYGEFGDKHGLFVAAAQHYVQQVVSPAFSRVEQSGAGLAEVAGYLDQQLDMAQRSGLPGVGCLLGNAMLECAPHDAAIGKLVAAHVARLECGYRNAIGNEARERGRQADVTALAHFATTATQGLWGMCRIATHAEPLRASAALLIDGLRRAVEASSG